MASINEIMAGIATNLYQLTGYVVYIEFKKNDIQFPCFYIDRLSETQEHKLGDRYYREHDFDIHFFLNESDEIKDVRNEINKIAEALLMNLEYIPLSDGKLIRGEDMHYRVTDGVLHFFVSYNVFVLKERDSVPLMENLIQKGTIKNG